MGKLIDILTSGVGGKIADKALSYLPTSAADKSAIREAIVKSTRAHEIALLQLANDQDREFNARLSALEGTAKDLQQFGWLGRVVIFLRGMQRPLWGYAVLVWDVFIFSGRWTLDTELLESAFWVINVLVLGFLFGERAVKNVMPLINGMKK